MSQKRHYEVRYGFPVRIKGAVVWIDRSKAGVIDELLTEKQIAEHVAAGNLVDNGAVIDEPLSEESELGHGQ